jgi:uncharacterized protein (TIRG00374 family)
VSSPGFQSPREADGPPAPKTRPWLKVGLQLTAGVLFLAWVFHAIFYSEALQLMDASELAKLSRVERWKFAWTEGPGRLVKTLSTITPGAFLTSLAVMGCILLTGVARWRMVLRVHGLLLPWSRAIEISLVSHFFNSFLLGSAGGDVMRAIYTARDTHHKKTEAVVTVFIDRILGLWGLLLFGCLLMVPNWELITRHSYLRLSCWVVIAMTAACSGIVLLSLRSGLSKGWKGSRQFLRRLPKGAALERSLDACRRFGQEPLFVSRTLAVSLALNLLCVLHVQVVANGLNIPLAPLLTALIVPVITALIAMPITPSGLGMRENFFVYLLCDKAVGIDATAALSLSLLVYAGSLFWSLVGGVVYLRFRRQHSLLDPSAEKAEAEALSRELETPDRS